jgi:ATP-binding cassette subfamily B protein
MFPLRLRIREFLNITFRFQQAMRFVWDAGPIWIIGNIGLVLIQGLLPMLSLYMMKLLVDSVSVALTQPPAERTFQLVLQYLILTGVVALVSAVVSQISDSFTHIQGLTITDFMNDILHKKALEIDLEYYENPQYQDTLHRAQKEASYRPVVVLNSLVQLFQNTISLGAIAWLLFSFHWAIVPLLLVAVIPGVIVRILYSSQQYKLDRALTKKERQAWYYYFLMVTTDFAKEVRIFGIGETIRTRYQILIKEIRKVRV